MTVLAFGAAIIIGEGQEHEQAWLVVRDGQIEAISAAPPQGAICIDLGAAIIAPGLIDVHIHGRESHDVMDGTPEALRAISRSLAVHGVTGFLATTVTSGWDRTLHALDLIGRLTGSEMPGARLLGAYSEGLFFSCKHKGAHNEAFFLPPTPARIDAMEAAARGALRVVALAPEIEGAMETLVHAAARGLRVVLGHTDATYDQTCAAIAAGAVGGVHLFNGMRGLHHREPGCAGALLLEKCSVEVIADGVHLHPAILKLIARLKPAEDILLISDCMCAGGLPDGHYRLGETDVTMTDGVVRTDAGGLAGSTLTIDRAVVRLADTGEVGFAEAVRMASLYPARFAGVDGMLGSLAPGKRADLAIFEDGGRVVATLVDGKPVHLAPASRAAAKLEILATQ